MKEKYIKICPKCGSTDLDFDNKGNDANGTSRGVLNYYCKNCKYNNTFFPEIKESEIKEYKKSLNKKK